MSERIDVALPPGWRLEILEEAGSTNDEVRLRHEEPHGFVLLAEKQTDGRGRRGAAWLSSVGQSLTFSILLKPSEPAVLWPRLSLAAGLAVAEALGSFGLEAEIKWPNDVLIRGRKIAGILIEGGTDFVVVGIGLNLGMMEFPEGLEATSMRLELGQEVERDDVLSIILRSLNGWSSELGAGFPALIERLSERCALSGQTVSLMAGERRVQGRVVRIGDGGELLVETEKGIESFLQAHEVRPLI